MYCMMYVPHDCLLPLPLPLPLSPAVPPNITMQPVAVTPDETTTQCCAGVRVFLEDPSDPTLVFTAQVSTEDSPFTSRSITREGGVVYVQGLQAGTPYNIRLTAWNNFGSVTKNVSTTPLIGEMVCFVWITHVGRVHVMCLLFGSTTHVVSHLIGVLLDCLTSFINIIFLSSPQVPPQTRPCRWCQWRGPQSPSS